MGKLIDVDLERVKEILYYERYRGLFSKKLVSIMIDIITELEILRAENESLRDGDKNNKD